MIHVTIPATAKGEPIPLVKLGQGREEEHESGPLETPKTMHEKLRAAGYQEPVQKTVREEMEDRRLAGLAEQDLRAERDLASLRAEELPIVSQAGFRAGVICAILGGVMLGGVFVAWGIIPTCIAAAGCVGFVGGMILTQEWK